MHLLIRFPFGRVEVESLQIFTGWILKGFCELYSIFEKDADRQVDDIGA